MVNHAVPRIEQQITGHSFFSRDLHADFRLLVGRARQRDAELCIYLLCKARAVAAVGEGLASPYIRIAQELHAELDHGLPVYGSRAEGLQDRSYILCRIEGVPVGRIFKRIHFLLRQCDARFPDYIDICLHFLAGLEGAARSKPADFAGLNIQPVNIGIVYDVADIPRVHRSDDLAVRIHLLEDIEAVLRDGHSRHFIDLFKSNVECEAFLRIGHKVRA